MKFKIFGDLDAPDWILREVEVLSKLSAVRLRLLIDEIVSQLKGKDVNYDKVAKYTEGRDMSTAKAIVASVTYVIRNAVKYNAKPEVAAVELQQLGLPKTHANSIMRALAKQKKSLRERFSQQSLTLPRVSSVDWRLEFILASSMLQEVNAPSVQLNLDLVGGKSISFGVDQDKFRVLLKEMKDAQEIMETLA
eukprot:TRINITY_DN119_c0_g1_i1.p1 TRINITY_DN119_c0_g1~~TRINITY_DN119_c0_g1_i1.p1  ORF type:complete len:193 (+),score=51.44 TRINITY_DN119_c0_g1_i1:158-736(+)